MEKITKIMYNRNTMWRKGAYSDETEGEKRQ